MMHLQNLVTTATIPNSDDWQVAVVAVGPDQAAHWLENNANNRRISPGAVARYANLMRAGEWKTSPEPLLFARSGRLLNGQHRLRAVIAAGTPQGFLVIHNVSEQLFSVLDRGRTRSYAQANGWDEKQAQVNTRLAEIVFHGGRPQASDTEKNRVGALVQEAHIKLRAMCGSNKGMFTRAPYRAAVCARLIAGADEDATLDAYRMLALDQTERMPPYLHAVNRKAKRERWDKDNGGQAAANLSFARGWATFDPSQFSKTRVADADEVAIRSEVRAVFLRALEDANV